MRSSLFFILGFITISAIAQHQSDTVHVLIQHINNIDLIKIKDTCYSNYVNIPDENGKYPIHYAIEKGNPELIKIILDLGADINIKDNKGFSPLHYAVYNQKTSIVNYLLQKGANKFTTNNNHVFPIDIAYKLNNERIVSILISNDSIAKIIEKYRLWRNQFYLNSSTWNPESTEFKLAWIKGSILMGELYKFLNNHLIENELEKFKILEETQKHFEYENEFQMDMNYKISLSDQLLGIVAERSSNQNELSSLGMFVAPSNQSQIQLQALINNLQKNPHTPIYILDIYK